jgi:hypothetical protein
MNIRYKTKININDLVDIVVELEDEIKKLRKEIKTLKEDNHSDCASSYHDHDEYSQIGHSHYIE